MGGAVRCVAKVFRVDLNRFERTYRLLVLILSALKILHQKE